MGVMPKRVATAVLVLIAWQESTSFGGFSPLAQPREPLRQTRASMADVLAAAEGTMRNPAVQAAWTNLMTVVGNLQKGFDLLNGLNTAATNWEKWTDKSDPEYTRRGNKAKHVSDLVQSIKDNMKSNNNVMIPRVKLPEKQIRGTYIEQLMVAVLCDNVTGGLVAVHAESGSGKSVATMLAALEAGRSRPSDYYVVLQNNLNQRLCGFFRVSEASLMADIVDDFFFALRKEKIQLRLVFDNVLDSGATDDMNKDQLKALARAAGDWEHQVLFTMQEQEAAQSVADLNGATTRLAPQQDKAFGAYRWTQNEAEKLFQSLMSDSMPINIKKALAETKVPDEIGGWRPRDIKFFMTYGLKPVAPRRRMQAGWAGFTSYSKTKFKLHKLKTKQPHRVAPCK